MPGHSREVIALADAILEVERAEAALVAACTAQEVAGGELADSFMHESGAYDYDAIAAAHVEARLLARGHDNPPEESFDRDSVLSLLNDTTPPVEETRIEARLRVGDPAPPPHGLPCCRAKIRDESFVCTMPDGHDGVHVARGFNTVLAAWTAESVRVAPKRAEKVDPCIGSSLPAETNR